VKKQTFTPSEEILSKYAELIVQFGMQNRDGKKLKKGSVIRFTVPEVAKPLYYHLQQAILKNGHHPIGSFLPSNDEKYNFEKNFFDHAKKHQIEFYDAKRQKGNTSQIDGTIHILATTDPHALRDVDSKKVLQRSVAMRKANELRFKKINEGKLQWTIAMYQRRSIGSRSFMLATSIRKIL
jgi:leucyl aminopeptidase (aminopeptidase T)